MAKYLCEDSKRSNLIMDDVDRLANLPPYVDAYNLYLLNSDLARRSDVKEALEDLKFRTDRVEVRHTHPKSDGLLDYPSYFNILATALFPGYRVSCLNDSRLFDKQVSNREVDRIATTFHAHAEHVVVHEVAIKDELYGLGTTE